VESRRMVPDEMLMALIERHSGKSDLTSILVRALREERILNRRVLKKLAQARTGRDKAQRAIADWVSVRGIAISHMAIRNEALSRANVDLRVQIKNAEAARVHEIGSAIRQKQLEAAPDVLGLPTPHTVEELVENVKAAVAITQADGLGEGEG
jgi:hypothetical protein